MKDDEATIMFLQQPHLVVLELNVSDVMTERIINNFGHDWKPLFSVKPQRPLLVANIPPIRYF